MIHPRETSIEATNRRAIKQATLRLKRAGHEVVAESYRKDRLGWAVTVEMTVDDSSILDRLIRPDRG